MAALTAALIALSAAQAGMSFYGQRKSANSVQSQGDYEAGVYTQNAAQSDLQAADAVARGTQAESASRTNTSSVLGAQRAGYAGQGVDVSSGSAKDLQTETQQIGDFDALTIRNNALRQAQGFAVQAQQDRQAADFAKRGGQNAAAAIRQQSWGTLLTGGAQAVSQARDAGWFNRGGGSSVPRGTRVPTSGGYGSNTRLS